MTRSASLRKTLRRTLGAAGSQVEFHDSLDGAPLGDAALVVIDQQVRQTLSAERLEALGREARLIVIGESLEQDEVVAMLRGPSVNHVIAETEDPDDAEIVVTSVKLLSNDIFGLEKYLSWGAAVSQRKVRTYEEKREAMAVVCTSAKDVGARRPVIAKIESVVDELLMNALYDAPSAAGRAPRNTLPNLPQVPSPAATLADDDDDGGEGNCALLRWAADGRYFAVSVEDAYGALRKDSILEHLQRARMERGRPRTAEDSPHGAGLGLYFILSSVTRFIVNVTPGIRTEVVCLFDLKVAGRDADACARSLHVFVNED